MNTFKPPAPRGPATCGPSWPCTTARLRRAVREKDRGASAVELAIITAVLVGLAVAILAIMYNFANKQAPRSPTPPCRTTAQAAGRPAGPGSQRTPR